MMSRKFTVISNLKWQMHQLRFYSVKTAQKEVNSSFQDDWKSAEPFESIPSMNKFEAIKRFMPGGQYYKLGLVDMQKLLYEEYGQITKFPAMFNRPLTVMTFNPDDVRKVFRAEGNLPIRSGMDALHHFRKNIRPDIYDEFGGLITEQKEEWYKMRTLVNPVMMKPAVVKLYVPQVDSISKMFIEMIVEKRDQNNEVPPNFSDYLNMWSLESITRISLDMELGIVNAKYSDKNAENLIQLVRKIVSTSHEIELKPSIWKIYETKAFKELMSNHNELLNIVMVYVEKAMENLRSKPQSEDEESILEKLLKINKKVAVVMCADAVMAGVDTTSTGAIGVLYCLAKNQEKQENLRAELRRILPNKDDELTTEKMKNMPYLRAVIKEGFRLYPPTIGTARQTNEDLILSGYRVPKGTEVAMNMMMIQRDEEHFPQSEKFIPERWLKQNTDPRCPHVKDGHPFAYLPFGFGARMCVGRRLAELEIEILLTRLIRNYKFEWNYPDMKIKSLLVNLPDGDLKFKMTEV